MLTLIAVLGLIAFVAIAINSYDTERDVVAAAGSAPSDVEAPAPDSGGTALASPPVGGVATGGGGMAAARSGKAAVSVLAAVAALTFLGAAGMAWRQRLT